MFAESEAAVSSTIVSVVVTVFVLILLFALLMLWAKNFRRCPPNRLLVVYGKGHTAKVVHGGAVFVLPVLQDYAYLCLEPMRLELPKSLHARAAELGITLPQTWTFAISTDPVLMQNAAIRLLGLPQQEVERVAEDLIVGRIEKQLDKFDNAGTVNSTELIEGWAADVDGDLKEVGLKTLGYR